MLRKGGEARRELLLLHDLVFDLDTDGAHVNDHVISTHPRTPFSLVPTLLLHLALLALTVRTRAHPRQPAIKLVVVVVVAAPDIGLDCAGSRECCLCVVVAGGLLLEIAGVDRGTAGLRAAGFVPQWSEEGSEQREGNGDVSAEGGEETPVRWRMAWCWQ